MLIRVWAIVTDDFTERDPDASNVYMDFDLPAAPLPGLGHKENFWIPGIGSPCYITQRHFLPNHGREGTPAIEIFVCHIGLLGETTDGFLAEELIDLGWRVDKGKKENPLNLYAG